MSSDSHVALTRCYFCGGPGDILLASSYTSSGEPIINIKERFHSKVINMQACQGCQAYMKIGVILISIRDGEQEKVENELRLHPDRMPNPYRTGQFCVVREEFARRVFTESSRVMECRWAFVEDRLWQQMGLSTGNNDHTHPDELDEHCPLAECKKCGNRRRVDKTWRNQQKGMEITARCLVCNPNEGNRDFTMVPHVLKLYEIQIKSP